MTKLNQTIHFFSRIIFRSFQSLQSEETLNLAEAEDNYYGRGKYADDDEDLKDSMDIHHLRRRNERIEKKSENIRSAIRE